MGADEISLEERIEQQYNLGRILLVETMNKIQNTEVIPPLHLKENYRDVQSILSSNSIP